MLNEGLSASSLVSTAALSSFEVEDGSDGAASVFRNALSEFVYTRTYARWMPEEGRRETWAESVDRYLAFLQQERQIPEELVPELRRAMLRMEVLPSMRALWSAGEAARRDNTMFYNCMGVETEFITSEGVRKFSDFRDGDRIKVLTHTGAWKPAVVRSYGEQRLYEVDIARGRSAYTVRATRNHQWVLRDGSRTNAVEKGMHLAKPPSIVGSWRYEDSNPVERYYWALGYVYGDGTLVKDREGNYRYSMVRLCGSDKGRFLERFRELGFDTSEPPTFGGDAVAYTGKYLKTLPTVEGDGYENVVAFVRGFLDADGHKNPNGDCPSPFNGILSSGGESIDFIRSMFPVVGAYITREDDRTGQQTNFGTRPETSHFGLVLGFGDSHNSTFSVQDLRESTVETVWCLEVEDDHSFVLPNGIVTGNCSFVPLDNLKAFAELLYILMMGCGVGFSVERQFVNNLPVVGAPQGQRIYYTVEDSTEGWANAFYDGLVYWFKGVEVVYDYSQVREAGAPLKVKGGRASGPEPLKRLLDFAQRTVLGASGRQLTSLECHDIACMVGEIVMAGGVRRAALISFSDPDDDTMRHAKDWSRGEFPACRYMANNSAFWYEKPERPVFNREWTALRESGSGERGFFMFPPHKRAARKSDARGNPCGEILLRYMKATDPWTGEGGGGQFCNLSAAVMRSDDTRETMARKVRLAAWVGAIQSTFTNFPYLRPGWAQTCNEDRLLGVDITGQCDNPALSNDPEAMKFFNVVARETAKQAAAHLGINEPAAITCGKPSGNSSQLVDCASGFHPRYAPYYIRRVRIANTDPLFRLAREAGVPAHKDNSFAEWDDDKCPTWVMEFPVAAPKGAMTRNDETAIQQLNRYLHIMRTWCSEKGHNQSATIYVRDHEWDEVGEWVYANFDEITGLSFLPYDGGTYKLAPYEEITEAQYHDLMKNFPALDYAMLALYEREDMGNGAQEYACVGGSCEIDFSKYLPQDGTQPVLVVEENVDAEAK